MAVVADGDSNHATGILLACRSLTIFTAAAAAAGPNLNKATFAAALDEIGEIPYRARERPRSARASTTLKTTSVCRCTAPTPPTARPTSSNSRADPTWVRTPTRHQIVALVSGAWRRERRRVRRNRTLIARHLISYAPQ